MLKPRRVVQVGCFVAFTVAVGVAGGWDGAGRVLAYVIGADPAGAVASVVAARAFPEPLVAGALIVAATLIWGRVFCGWICPMGTLVDGADRVAVRPGGKTPRGLKYLILAFILGGAFAGAAWAFLAAPLPLMARLVGLVAQPLAAVGTAAGLDVLRPLASEWDVHALALAQVRVPAYATQGFVAGIFVGVCALAWLAPRFWCRAVCPAGALLALASWRPLWRRRVTAACSHCGNCARSCPTGAIRESDPAATLHAECIACRTCESACPGGGIRFGFSGEEPVAAEAPVSPSRRRLLTGGLSAAGLAAATPFALASPSDVVRPPGSRPEADFLARCLRCGACMAACPTNVIQPTWLRAGALGVFSPVLEPMRGYCDPDCNRCGLACPTEAIRPLALDERLWAKVGTAEIDRRLCLAWEDRQRCMVCDEVCPFDAVRFSAEPGIGVPVPGVAAEACTGCGRCENACPIEGTKAIVVMPRDALRLNDGAFRAEGERRGLRIARAEARAGYPEGGAGDAGAPGFLNGEEPPQTVAPPSGFLEAPSG